VVDSFKDGFTPFIPFSRLQSFKHRSSIISSDIPIENIKNQNLDDQYLCESLNPEKMSVDSATRHWIKTVTSGMVDASQKTTDLYDRHGVIWGTVSKELRKGQQEIRQYFDFFVNLPELSVVSGSYQSHIQLFGDIAISSGYYTFQFIECSEETRKTIKIVPARFTFIFKRAPTSDHSSYPFEESSSWKIINHHSSALPEQPPNLPLI